MQSGRKYLLVMLCAREKGFFSWMPHRPSLVETPESSLCQRLEMILERLRHIAGNVHRIEVDPVEMTD